MATTAGWPGVATPRWRKINCPFRVPTRAQSPHPDRGRRSDPPGQGWSARRPSAHRMASANSRLIALDDQGVTFQWKHYRAKDGCRSHPDAARRGVHVPLPAPCPALRRPPHRPLRAACQCRARGEPGACPRPVGATATPGAGDPRVGRQRTAGHPGYAAGSSLPLLLRTHARDRDFPARPCPVYPTAAPGAPRHEPASLPQLRRPLPDSPAHHRRRLGLARMHRSPLNVSQAVSETRPRIAVFTPLGWVEPRRSLPTAGSHLPNPSIGQTNPPSLASTRPHHPPSRGFLPRGLSDAYRRPRSPS